MRARVNRSIPSVVTVESGRYEQSQSLEFGRLDGGDDAASSVLWQGVGRASISFGSLVKSGDLRWIKKKKGSTLWQAQLNLESGRAVPRQMFDAETNERMTRARTPNAGTNFVIPLDGGLVNRNDGFMYKDGDLNRFTPEELETMEIKFDFVSFFIEHKPHRPTLGGGVRLLERQ